MKNLNTLIIGICLLLMALYVNQCNKNKMLGREKEQAMFIANQNMRAMSDSTIQLKMTREQLAQADSKLHQSVKKADSLIRALAGKKAVVREVIHTKIIATQTKSEVVNTARRDNADPTKYNLDFMVHDSVKTFSGTSSFFVKKSDSTVLILGDTTRIKDFKLNFEFSLVKYDDVVEKVTKYKFVPYYVDADGGLHVISENQLRFNFRGVDLLDKPFQENAPLNPGVRKKLRMVGLVGIGINPIGIGPVIIDNKVKLGYVPSISLGYFLTFMKK